MNESFSSAQVPNASLRSGAAGLRELQRVMWVIIGVSLTAHVLFLFAGRTALGELRWVHMPLHACVEFSGAMIAILVAAMLHWLNRIGLGHSCYTWIAAALVGMGLLDGFHALSHVGQTFVWLHSAATLAGGILFAMVWLPNTWAKYSEPWWLWAVVGTSVCIGLVSLVRPDVIPAMVIEGEFTTLALSMNIVGGLMLLLAAVQLLRTYWSTADQDYLLFCMHCFLFAAAALMFEQSNLWDVAWWGWHLLRLLAYAVAFVFVVRAVHHTQQINERMRSRAELLSRSNDHLQEFAQIASHDLQEPLRSVSNFLQLIKRRYHDRLDAQGVEWIDIAVNAAERMKQLIEDLLAYSRVQSRAAPFQSVKAHEALHDAIARLKAAIDETSAVITYDSLPVVVADRTQLVQVFQNLLSNAIKYRSQEKPQIHVAAAMQNGSAVFSVKDNGIGIDLKHAKDIFRVFTRLHTKAEYSGTGIGLAICRGVIERHGGRIWTQSEPGGGSTFYFTLPKQRSEKP